MSNLFHHATAALRSLVTRGKVVSATLGQARTMLQLTGMAGETANNIPLLLPYAMSALPTGQEDVILLQVGGSRSHLVALCADSSGLRITDLQAGEFGWRDVNAQQIVFRKDHLEITTAQKVIGTASEWDITGAVKVTGDLTVTGNIHATGDVGDAVRRMRDDRSYYNGHTHNIPSGASVTNSPLPQE